MNSASGVYSPLDEFFRFLVESEIPSLYFLIETVFLAIGWCYFIQVIVSLKNVRQLTGIYSQMTFQVADVSPTALAAKFIAAVFLMNYGAGQALFANSMFVDAHFEAYSAEMFRDISCANGATGNCLYTQLGLYADNSWKTQIINQNLFKLATSMAMITGAISYGLGWRGIARFQEPPSGKAPPTLGGALTQIGLGVAFMHPQDLWQLIS